jgi:transposase
MIQITPQMRILVAVKPVDFRYGIDRLCGICRQALKIAMNPNVGWIIARQGIALSDMLYLITDFPEVSIP